MGYRVPLWIAALVASLSCAPAARNAKPPMSAPTPGATPSVGTVAPPTAPSGSAPQSTTSNSPPAPPPGGAGSFNGPPPGGPPPGGPPPGGFGRPRLTPAQNAARRDSLDTMRAGVVQELSQRIAGYENRRAEDEFTNIQLLKDTTASELLTVMNSYGHALGVGCSYCHVPGKWDEDSKDEKRTARRMIAMVNAINDTLFARFPANRAGRTPVISCITCHRGYTHPNSLLAP